MPICLQNHSIKRYDSPRPLYHQDELLMNSPNIDSFLNDVLESQQVWGLKHPDMGWAICESNEYEDTTVYVFWSDEPSAQQHISEEWSEYQATPIELEIFIEDWLFGMSEEGLLAGINWDENLIGDEVEPSDLAELLADN